MEIAAWQSISPQNIDFVCVCVSVCILATPQAVLATP